MPPRHQTRRQADGLSRDNGIPSRRHQRCCSAPGGSLLHCCMPCLRSVGISPNCSRRISCDCVNLRFPLLGCSCRAEWSMGKLPDILPEENNSRSRICCRAPRTTTPTRMPHNLRQHNTGDARRLLHNRILAAVAFIVARHRVKLAHHRGEFLQRTPAGGSTPRSRGRAELPRVTLHVVYHAPRCTPRVIVPAARVARHAHQRCGMVYAPRLWRKLAA